MSKPDPVNFMSVVNGQLDVATTFVSYALRERIAARDMRDWMEGRFAPQAPLASRVTLFAELRYWGVDADEAAGLPQIDAQRVGWGIHFVATPDGRTWAAHHRVELNPMRPVAAQVRGSMPEGLEWRLLSADGSTAVWEVALFTDIAVALQGIITGDAVTHYCPSQLSFRIGPAGPGLVEDGWIKQGPGGSLDLGGFFAGAPQPDATA